MKRILLLFVIQISLYGTPLDYFYLYKADSLVKEGKTSEALYYYKQIDEKTDEIHYNMGNLFYKEKSYEKAISSYKNIKDTKLLYQTLHNLGNSYEKMGNKDEAIKNYEKALTIKNDKDTLFNLELLKQKKQENEKEQNKKENNSDANKENQNHNPKKEDKNKESTRHNEEMKNKDQQLNQDKIQKEKVQNQVRKAGELSDLEEKKWSQILENRDIKTLVIPISNSGEKNGQNIKPW
jgi:Ca-activated chloride channel family protein